MTHASANLASLVDRPHSLFGAGVVTIANTLLSALPGVDVSALPTVTGAVSILTALFVPLLPWARRSLRGQRCGPGCHRISGCRSSFDHFSRSESSVAVYPIFFIMVVAWSGLIQVCGAPTLAACLSRTSEAF